MSLEQVISELNTNIVTLIGALNAQAGETAKTARAAKKAAAPEQTQPATPAAPPASSPVAAAAAQPVASSPAIDLRAECTKTVTSLVRDYKATPRAVKVLEKYGAKKVPELKNEQLAAALADLQAEVVAAKAAQ